MSYVIGSTVLAGLFLLFKGVQNDSKPLIIASILLFIAVAEIYIVRTFVFTN